MNQERTQSGEISLRFVGSIIKSKARRILIYSILVILISSIFSIFIPNKYSSSSTLSPNKDNQSLEKTNFSDLGNITSLIGVGQGVGSSVSNFQIALEKIKSRDFIEKFINYGEMKLKLLFALRWNPAKENFEYNLDMYDPLNSSWKVKIPSDYEIFKDFKKNLTITKKSNSGLVEISFKSKSPHLSQDVVENMIFLINDVMSSEALNKAATNLTFLNKEINNQQNIQTKNAISRLMEIQLQKKMIASNNKNYIFDVVSPPLIAEEKSSPWKLGIIISSLFIFNFLYIFYHIFLFTLKK